MRRGLLAFNAAVIVATLSLSAAAAPRTAPPQGTFAVSRIPTAQRVLGLAVDPATNVVYTGGYGPARGDGSVTPIDGTTGAAGTPITVPGVPFSIAVDPVTDTIYAYGYDGLTAIDGATGTVLTTIALSYNGQVGVDPATDTVYAATALPNGTGTVTVIDGATNKTTATVSLGSATGIQSLAVNPATDTIYSGTETGSVYAIDGARDTVSASIQLGSNARVSSVAADTATGTVYAVDWGTNTVHPLNGRTLAAAPAIAGCPQHVAAAAADPAGGVVLVASDAVAYPSLADSTCVIDADTNTIIGTFPRGGVAAAPDATSGVTYIASWAPVTGIWVARPASTSEVSPMIYGFPTFAPATTFAVGVATSAPLEISALPTATLTETGRLPAGITMSAAGVFSGTPAADSAGTYPITVTAANGLGPASTAALTIIVNIAPKITSPAAVTFRTGTPGTFAVKATGSPAPAISAVDYPGWMSFTAGTSSATLAGTPPPGSGGVYPVYVWADNGSPVTARQRLMVTVDQPPTIIAAARIGFRIGRRGRYLISTTGYPVPRLAERGPLPRGLAFRTEPGGYAAIVGQPFRSDKGKRYLITITASNRIGHPVTRKITIVVG
ncbi:MAG: putative Ig domain-containing protein [Streptosporangiaceae bacterium]